MKKKSLISFFCAVCVNILAQSELPQNSDSVSVSALDEVVVTAERASLQSDALRVVTRISGEELRGLPVATLNDLLNNLPGIDIRSRGAGGTQADITMRGGTFDQVLVLLNGINLTDPHTGHYSLDVPIDIQQVDRIEVLQGTGMNLFGLNAFAGAINIITKPLAADAPKRWSLDASVTAGGHKLFNPALAGKVRHGIWWLNASAEHNQSSGYIHNTQYHISNAYLQTGWDDVQHSGNWQLQAGGQLKDYGANAFYSLKYPEQYETTRTLFASAQWNKVIKRFSVSASAYWRTHYDCFELIHQRDLWPSWYTGHNYHVTHVAAANVQGSYHSRIGKTSVGIEVKDEYIKSNVLGDALSTPLRVPFGADTTFIYAKNRLNVNYFAEQSFHWRGLSASVGFAGNYNTMFGNNFSLGANIGYEFTEGGHVYANVNRSLRLPTFTDLYYKSATQIANPNLKPEKSVTAELGIKWCNSAWNTRLTAYYRHGTDIIDWVKAPEEEKWRSMNHTSVNAMGGEALVGWRYGYWVKKLEVAYSFTHLDKDAGGLLSKYALDYLRHKLTVTFEHGIWRGFGAAWVYGLQSRHGDYTDVEGNVVSYKPFWTLDLKVYWQGKHTTVFAEATNLFGRDYCDYGGLPQPGRWIKGGVKVSL